jgi:hypothetical protein
MRFSEKYGHKTARERIQIDSIDEALRNSLWSLLKIYLWDKVYSNTGAPYLRYHSEMQRFCSLLWFRHFKNPLDTLPDEWYVVLSNLRTHFFNCLWWEVYDFVEFTADNFPYTGRAEFIESCNGVLENELSAYRFVNRKIAPITDGAEVSEIDSALERARGPVRTHLRRALELLSDRQSPDYRNSIKESISAVESLVGTVLGEKGTLGQLVKKLKDEIDLHPALGVAFEKLYGYTSDEEGIRHAILESETVGFAEAKFFLVICSAFVNFVESKVTPPG